MIEGRCLYYNPQGETVYHQWVQFFCVVPRIGDFVKNDNHKGKVVIVGLPRDEINNQESDLHVPLTPNEVMAAKFKLGRLINHLVGVYNLPDSEVEEHKQDTIEAVRRIK